MSEQRNRNYVETVTLDKINDYSDTFVEYDDARDNEERINVSGSATIVYNGRVTASDIDDLITANLTRAGSIQFLCTEGEGSPADVIFFTSYTNWYVTSTTPSSKTVYGEKAGVKDSIVIDDESRTKNVTITKDGKTASFSSIAKGQILSISKSDDNSVIDVIISDDTVSGLVQGKNTDKNTLTVQAKEYTFTDGIDVSTINLGITLKLYLDAFGKVAKYTHQTTSSNLTYGYLLTASVDGNSMNPQVALKILKLNTTSTSSPDELYLADTVTINNTNYKPINDADGILTLLKDTAEYYDAASGDYEFASGKVFQPIRYSKNAEGKISSLYIGTQSVTATDSDLKVDRSFADVGDEITCTMTGSNPTFQYLYKLNSATKVVYVPDNDTDRANNDKYIIRNGNNAGFTQGVQYRIVMVDTSTSSTPAVVIVYSDPSGVSSTEWEECTPKLVVDKSRGTGEYEYEIMLEGSNGEATPYYDETGSFYGAVNIGDVVRVSVSTGNKVEEFEVAAEAKEIYAGTEYIKPITHLTEVAREVDKSGTPMNGTYPLHKEGDRSVTRKIVMYAGVAFDIVENSMLIAMDYPEAANWDKTALTNAGNLRNINVSGAKVLVVEFNNGIVDNIEASDVGQIMTYEDAEVNANKLFVYCYGDTANLIVVYRSR